MAFGSLLALSRNLPLKIWYWLGRRFTITVDISNDDPLFEWFSLFLSKHPYSQKARILTASTRKNADELPNRLKSDEDELPQIILTPAPGNHFFIHDGCMIWLNRQRQNAENDKGGLWSIRKKETFVLRIFGFNREVLSQMLREVRTVASQNDRSTINIYVSGDYAQWHFSESCHPRPLSSIFLPGDMAEKISEDVKSFLCSKDWYIQRGIPYRKSYLFEGVNGSGKTSLIRSLAGERKMNLYILNVGSAELTDCRLYELMAHVPRKSVILLEDIDAAFNQRISNNKNGEGVTFSALLNVLDGAASKEGNIVFMTTNHLEKLDPALIRPGRVDMKVHFDYANYEQITRMFEAFYPNEDCKIDILEFIDSLPSRPTMAEVQQRLMSLSKVSSEESEEQEVEILQISN